LTIWFFHPWLLEGLAKLVIVNNPRSTAGYLALFSPEVRGDYYLNFDAAAAAYREDSHRQILLIKPQPTILEKHGILPGFVEASRRELASRGVEDSAIETIPANAANAWDAARSLGEWLQKNPGAEVVYIGERFENGLLSCIVRQVLRPELAERITYFAMPPLDFDETNWWQNRDGVKTVMFSCLSLLYIRCQGAPDAYRPRWDPDDYARRLENHVR
jgi:hypothetical protein